ncbi:hypothetical protein [Variovorax boronicumulans]|uniref:hypothetical protein n=1 Tax=Variovorax boronicumulans TaxID=436515 RepID=UPI0033914499
MTTPGSTAKGHRAQLSFSTEGLPAREVILLKSLVRLLDHRTHQQWSWKAEQADLRVVGEQAPAADDATARHVPVLIVGHVDPQHGHFLALPLHTDALENALNRLGALVLHAWGLGIASPEAPAADGEEFRLSQWPPSALLETPARLKMATLLTGRPASLAALQQRSAATAKDCADFLAELKEAGLIEIAVTGMTPPNAQTAHANAAEASSHASERHSVQPSVQPGLLARIRSRLGLLSSGSR